MLLGSYTCRHKLYAGSCPACREAADEAAARFDGCGGAHHWSMIDRDGRRRCTDCGLTEEHSSLCMQEVPIEPTTLAGQFDRDMEKLTQDRGTRYGHPLDGFTVAGQIADAVASCPDAAVRHALCMIGVKMSRLCATPWHYDSALDIAGYARTILMIADERKNREETD